MAIEKSYIDMLKERDAKIEALKELLRLSHESMDSKDAKIAELKEQLEEAMTFNVDVVRCLSRIASVENHNEVPAYIDMSRRCIKTIEAKQAKALKEQVK
jgi:DNA-binding transcriptional regulator GbsR (MarR family)